MSNIIGLFEKGGKMAISNEALFNMLCHSATTDQLESVRKELDQKIEKHADKLDNLRGDTAQHFESLDSKIDRRTAIICGLLLTNIAAIVAAAFWIGLHVH